MMYACLDVLAPSNNDKDNNSGFMDQDIYDPKDDAEDGRIVTVLDGSHPLSC
jgi:hypothetical protein